MVLVVEHVAVDHELAEVVAEVARDEDPFGGEDEEGVLEAVFPGRGRPAVALEQVPVGVVHVDQVGDRGLVDHLPGDGAVDLREGVGAGGVEGAPVDHPGRREVAPDFDLPSVIRGPRDVPGPGRQRPQPVGDLRPVAHPS